MQSLINILTKAFRRTFNVNASGRSHAYAADFTLVTKKCIEMQCCCETKCRQEAMRG